MQHLLARYRFHGARTGPWPFKTVTCFIFSCPPDPTTHSFGFGRHRKRWMQLFQLKFGLIETPECQTSMIPCSMLTKIFCNVFLIFIGPYLFISDPRFGALEHRPMAALWGPVCKSCGESLYRSPGLTILQTERNRCWSI